jgi:hypothetical protein
MQVTTLKNPGDSPLAQTVRKEVARVISQLEDADVTGTPSPLFAAFLADAATLTPGYAGPIAGGTNAVVANGGTVNVENSAGALDSPATATVAAGVLTGVKLAATKTILTNALKFSGVTITGTGTFFTPTIVNGVLTGGVLSAS